MICSMRASRHRYRYDEYVALDALSNVKLEYFDGEIYAMAGGTPEHGELAVAVSTELRTQLEGKPCKTYSSDVRIRVEATGLATYPDVSVVCGEVRRAPDDRTSVLNPIVLIEVLSDSTGGYDRGEKFDSYRQLPSLREYVLVSHRERLIEVFRRSGSGEWIRSEARSGASMPLESVGCELPVDRIYRGVELQRA
jgi:Uma2 family endonuclease